MWGCDRDCSRFPTSLRLHPSNEQRSKAGAARYHLEVRELGNHGCWERTDPTLKDDPAVSLPETKRKGCVLIEIPMKTAPAIAVAVKVMVGVAVEMEQANVIP